MPVATLTAGSPVSEAYARLTAAVPGMRVTELSACDPVPRGAGWVGADELAAGGDALAAFLAWDDAQVLRDHGRRGRPDVIAGFGLHRYAWYACLLVTAPWFLLRRVPTVPVAGTAFHRTERRLAVRTEGFACLPDDPAAGLPGARVVADEAGLRAEVRTAVAAHFAPLLDGFGPRLRRGRRAQWGMATDEVVDGLWYLAQRLGEEDRARAELELLLPANQAAPYTGAPGFRNLTAPDGRELPTRDRVSCCLSYTLDPADTCLSCPRTSDAERLRRMTEEAAC
ncbi:(2Fe-2S)-binding protein [Streptomyces sp. NPDC089919]|uniref:(2Fe-2S)-binding protein n=1 Tax=Streptomyces sp. NPDC089919 TaxID=3155188 RepID=UPI003419C0F3